MKNFLIYDGVRSCDYGLYISGSGAFNAPERDVEVIEVSGRNGNLILDNGRYKNIAVSYPAYISREFSRYAAATRDWLCSRTGYFRLEDTYNPEYFRLARFSGPMDFETRFQNWGAETNLFFDCKPQRYLKSGEIPVAWDLGYPGILNPTSFPALPLVKITAYGSGSASITFIRAETGEYWRIDIAEIDEYIVLDSDLQDAYKGTKNENSKVLLTEFPVLYPGFTEISISDNISVEITPRWWTL